MINRYEIYFILSLFDQERRPSQLYHILQGKRSGSTLFQAYRQDLLKYFALLPKLKRRDFDQSINKLISLGAIKENEDSYRLTERGQEWVERYFEKEFYPSHIDQALAGGYDLNFWKKLQFTSQVLSEKAHHNKHYQPLSSSLEEQYGLKRWLSQYENQSLIQDYYQEWVDVLQELEDELASLIVDQLTGHGQIGLTLQQCMPTEGPQLLLIDQIHLLIKQILKENEGFYYMKSLVKLAYHQSFEQLSKSAYESKRMLKQGMTLKEIASQRQVKLGTIVDHIIEIAIFQGIDLVSHLYSSEDFQRVDAYFKRVENGSYRHFLETEGLEAEDFPFYKYRLSEIERVADHDD